MPPLRFLLLEPSPLGFNACLGWYAQNICLVDFTVVRVLLSLLAHLVLFNPRLPGRCGPKSFHDYSCLLSLLDALGGSDPAFFIIWSRFRQLWRYLSYRPQEEDRIFRLLDYASSGSPGMGPFIFLLSLLMRLAFFWILSRPVGFGPGLDPCVMMSGPSSIFVVLYGKPGKKKRPLIFADEKVFGREGVVLLICMASHQLLVSSHLRERDKMLLRAILSGGVWNGFLLSKAKKRGHSPVGFCRALDNDGHIFGECTFLPFEELRNNPEFLPLMNRDRTNWPRCLLWHGWLLG